MAKFKVGDKVRILDGSKIENYTGNWMCVMNKYINTIATITEVVDCSSSSQDSTAYIVSGISRIRKYFFDERGLELVETRNIHMPDIIGYKYNENTAVTIIEWSDGTKTTVRAENPDTADPYTGFVAAYAKKAAGNNNMINKLYDEWAIKKPAREAKAQIKANAAALEKQRIAKKRKAKKEQYLIRKRAAEINKEYEAKKLAHEKYGVPMDYKAGDTN